MGGERRSTYESIKTAIENSNDLRQLLSTEHIEQAKLAVNQLKESNFDVKNLRISTAATNLPELNEWKNELLITTKDKKATKKKSVIKSNRSSTLTATRQYLKPKYDKKFYSIL